MNRAIDREDILYFSIIYFVAFFLALFCYVLYHDKTEGPILQTFFLTCHFSIPSLCFIRKGKIYAIIYALYVLIIFWLFYLIQMRGEMLIWNRWEGYWLDAWEFIFILLSMGIYYGFKIMIKEYLKYRNLAPDEKRIQKSFKCIIYRVSFFILSLFIPIVILIIWLSLNIGEGIIYPYTF